jgi:DnaJ domain
VSTQFSPQLDPAVVLGVSRQASLDEIRTAYRGKAKRYHPDTGGEEWVFKIVAQAYEIMSIARVVQAAERETVRPQRRPTMNVPPRSSASNPEPSRGASGRPRTDQTETVRPGLQEEAVHPSQVVELEKLTVRFEADHVWLITEHAADQRLLSCCLNIVWPVGSPQAPAESTAGNSVILTALSGVFDATCKRSKPVSSRSSVLEGRFSGWLSFENSERASAAFALLVDQVHAAGLVVRQLSRDVIIPRDWR